MYHTLADNQKDLHRFLWRETPREQFQHHRMTRLTFGVSASSFVANMALRQNALGHLETHPQAARVALDCFYVDDGLMGAFSIDEAIKLRTELQNVFNQGGFKLQKWNTGEREVLASIPENLQDMKRKQEICHKDEYTKVLGVEWNVVSDSFRPVIFCRKESETLTKWMLVSNIVCLFDILGWCSPAIIQMKILLQLLWEHCWVWDEPVPKDIEKVWKRWYKELPLLKGFSVPRPYFPKEVTHVL